MTWVHWLQWSAKLTRCMRALGSINSAVYGYSIGSSNKHSEYFVNVVILYRLHSQLCQRARTRRKSRSSWVVKREGDAQHRTRTSASARAREGAHTRAVRARNRASGRARCAVPQPPNQLQRSDISGMAGKRTYAYIVQCVYPEIPSPFFQQRSVGL